MKGLLALAGAFALALAPAYGRGPTVRYYGTSITPTSVVAASTTSFALDLTNCSAATSAVCGTDVTTSTQNFGSATVDVPAAGLTVVPGSILVSASGGKTWSAGLSGNTIILGAGPVAAGINKIDPGESLTLTFSAMASCSANTYTLTTAVYQDTLNSDGSVNTATPYTLANSQPTVTVTGGCDPPALIGYCTFTQGGWGADPAGNNPGQVLASYFSSAYPGGSVQVGGTHSMMFTSAAGVDAYLPAGGPPSVLSADYSNPASTSSGVFGGQVLALRLNVNFQSYIPGASNSITGLKLKGTGTSLDGSTVPAIEAAAETALGGGALPAGFSISSLNTLIDSLNSAFDGCTTSDWANAHLTAQ